MGIGRSRRQRKITATSYSAWDRVENNKPGGARNIPLGGPSHKRGRHVAAALNECFLFRIPSQVSGFQHSFHKGAVGVLVLSEYKKQGYYRL